MDEFNQFVENVLTLSATSEFAPLYIPPSSCDRSINRKKEYHQHQKLCPKSSRKSVASDNDDHDEKGIISVFSTHLSTSANATTATYSSNNKQTSRAKSSFSNRLYHPPSMVISYRKRRRQKNTKIASGSACRAHRYYHQACTKDWRCDERAHRLDQTIRSKRREQMLSNDIDEQDVICN